MASVAEEMTGKRVGVSMASGFFGFFHHAGVLVALAQKGIRPLRVTGTSAGALTASLYAAGMEPQEIADFLTGLCREDFWDMQWPFTRLGFALLKGDRFRKRLAAVLPVDTFEACRVPLAVGAYDLARGRVRHFAAGPLVPAIYASCAYPYLLAPIEIDGVPYWDGGFGEKTPLVPFLGPPSVDLVFVSYLPSREKRRGGLREFVPSISSLFAFSPLDERIERDKRSVALLREAGIEVVVCAPPRVLLGPFSMARAREAFEQGRNGALALLESQGGSLLGSADLS